ncbi:alpha/beta hydrolase [Actinoalloteichus hymeniacidonis]|uniref:Esterase/lipase n=1 Tax=Actinoalloteichus hymeniacidonis TaxID=340345 RepID=A0AAC9HUE3_9PSEU|nr:alpha/beta fold hydrolase [Actinoalloteichus hymeniacidonis]AOS65121.1 esterase/lipase [Actinoalloteichus hymeniacidonis]MBB5906800.1 carboxylesterase [Actinoalloteichus hymeniacidonis]
MPVMAGAEPFNHDASGEIGVLLCHGFTGSPQSMRGWAEHLAEAGVSVRLPLLPGHGTQWRELNRTRWQDWYDCDAEAFDELRARCGSVYVFGQSMGGTLALRLAQQRGDQIAGLALVNPSVMTLRKAIGALPLLSRVWPSLPGIAGGIAKPGVMEIAYDRLPLRAMASLADLWRLVHADLPVVTQPMLLCTSPSDPVVEPENSEIIANRVRSEDLTRMTLSDSSHVATLDYDAPRIFERSLEFVRRLEDERTGSRS